MKLPNHKIYRPVEIPLICDGMGIYELACWSDYAYRHKLSDLAIEVDRCVKKLPLIDQAQLNKLTYYKPYVLEMVG